METRTESERNVVKALISEFSVYNAKGDATELVLNCPGRLYLFCLTSLNDIPQSCQQKLDDLAVKATILGQSVVVLTPEPLYEQTSTRMGGLLTPCYNIDASTMKTLLRARNGVVVLDNGTITGKFNCMTMRLH